MNKSCFLLFVIVMISMMLDPPIWDLIKKNCPWNFMVFKLTLQLSRFSTMKHPHTQMLDIHQNKKQKKTFFAEFENTKQKKICP